MGTIWEPGAVLLEDYQVERFLGRGGMGRVYLVRSRSTGHPFAVKCIRPELVRRGRTRRAFLRELMTWSELPGHPNLVAFRFFRSLGHHVLIFSEFVEGGSLKSWIAREDPDLVAILDVAIQTAQGLHVAHELGVIHQDVKPGNILLTPDRVAKITDFGLARVARPAGELGPGDQEAPPGSPRTEPSVLVSCAAGTPAFSSPEQLASRILTRRTDIWSWGLTVLALLSGGSTWKTGALAGKVLEELVREGLPRGEALHPTLAEILRRCLIPEPRDRWSDMQEVVQALREAHPELTGGPYPRQLVPVPPPPPSLTPEAGEHPPGERSPEDWLRRLVQESGGTPEEAERLLLPNLGSWRGRGVAEMATLEEAQRILEGLLRSGRDDLEPDLARILLLQARLHGELGDLPGCLTRCDRAIQLLRTLIDPGGRRDLEPELASALSTRGNALTDGGMPREARAVLEEAVRIMTSHPGEMALRLLELTAQSSSSLARTLRLLGEGEASLPHHEQAVRACEELIRLEANPHRTHLLGMVIMNQANALQELGEKERAHRLFDRTFELLEPLVQQEGRWKVAHSLALAYMNKGGRGQNPEERQESVRRCGQAIRILERLVNQEGRRDLVEELARAWANLGVTQANLVQWDGALHGFQQADEIYQRLVASEGRRDLRGLWAITRAYQAPPLNELGRPGQARDRLEEAEEILRIELERTGRSDLKRALEWIDKIRADIP